MDWKWEEGGRIRYNMHYFLQHIWGFFVSFLLLQLEIMCLVRAVYSSTWLHSIGKVVHAALVVKGAHNIYTNMNFLDTCFCYP